MPTPATTVAISVDSAQVDRLFDAFQRSISPGALSQFMLTDVVEYWERDLFNRFASKSGDRKARWEPLKVSTMYIREAEGFTPDWPNTRSGDMFSWLHGSVKQGLTAIPGGAQLSFPGSPPDSVLEEKLRTAQQGKDYNLLGFGPTPARPVLAADTMDLQAMLGLLGTHMIAYVSGILR